LPENPFSDFDQLGILIFGSLSAWFVASFGALD
jgi:hypothetical protein